MRETDQAATTTRVGPMMTIEEEAVLEVMGVIEVGIRTISATVIANLALQPRPRRRVREHKYMTPFDGC